jgi:hypothetical protein
MPLYSRHAELFSVKKQIYADPFSSSRGGNKKRGVHMISIYLFDLIKNEQLMIRTPGQ